MRFVFRCLVAGRPGGAKLLLPLQHPELNVVSSREDDALSELALVLDDRLTRVHPRELARWHHSDASELVELDLPVLDVWTAQGTREQALTLSVVITPVQAPYVEVYAPRLEIRYWIIANEDVGERAAMLFSEHMRTLSQHERLALRGYRRESLISTEIEPALTPLSRWRYHDLFCGERIALDPSVPDAVENARVEVLGDNADKLFVARRYDALLESDDPENVQTHRDDSRAEFVLAQRYATATLARIGEPWHLRAKDATWPRAHGQDALIAQVLKHLASEDSPPDAVVLVGPEGSGKTTILGEIAARMSEARCPDSLKDRGFYALDSSRLIAGDGGFGEWQGQLLTLLDEARASGSVIHLGSIVDLLDAGRSADRDENVSQILGPALAARELRAVGEATIEAWSELERRAPTFARSFAVVRVTEPAEPIAREIMREAARAMGQTHSLVFSQDALDRALLLARRFWPYGAALGHAIAFVRRVATSASQSNVAVISAEEMVERFAGESGIPSVLLRDDRPLDPVHVRSVLEARVVGQRHAVERVVDVVSVLKAGLYDVRKPVATLLFAGPTGVGKTELSRALAQLLFGAEERLVRLDMGEYAGPDALTRLIGSWRSPGALCAAVRRQPFCVILLDEIEKAHPAVFDALLGVLGEGRLRDSQGRSTDFRSTVLIMTSNLGATGERSAVGFAGSSDTVRAARQHYVAEAQAFFRPELFNRIDDMVVFAPLSAEAAQSVVMRELKKLSSREGLRKARCELVPTLRAVDHLAHVGIDARYGARPLKRAIEQHVVTPLAAFLATQSDTAHGGRVTVDCNAQGQLTFRGQASVRDNSGMGRVVEVVELASELRALVQRWSSAPLAISLRDQLQAFDRNSRLEEFWHDHALAEAAARTAAQSKTLLSQLDGLLSLACASEDLAYEAYFERSVPGAEALMGEFLELRAELTNVRSALYLATQPAVNLQPLSVLYLSGSRASWRWLLWLREGYVAYAKTLGLRVTSFLPVRNPDAHPSAQGARPRARARVVEAPDAFAWSEHELMPVDGAPMVCAVVIRGAQGRVFASEQGAHRFVGDGVSVIKAAFACVAHEDALLAPGEIEKALRDDEVRRIAPQRGSIRDLRTQVEVLFDPAMTPHADMAPLIEAWVNAKIEGREH